MIKLAVNAHRQGLHAQFAHVFNLLVFVFGFTNQRSIVRVVGDHFIKRSNLLLKGLEKSVLGDNNIFVQNTDTDVAKLVVNHTELFFKITGFSIELVKHDNDLVCRNTHRA